MSKQQSIPADWRRPDLTRLPRRQPKLTNDTEHTELVIVTFTGDNTTATVQTIFDTREETVTDALKRLAIRHRMPVDAAVSTFGHLGSYRVNEGVKTHYSVAHHYHHQSVAAHKCARHLDNAYWCTKI